MEAEIGDYSRLIVNGTRKCQMNKLLIQFSALAFSVKQLKRGIWIGGTHQGIAGKNS
jgi:hypothetical protein